MRAQTLLLTAVLTSAVATHAAGEVYKCTEGGKTVYSDRPCANDAAKVAIPPSQDEVIRAERKAKSDAAKKAAAAKPRVTCEATERIEARMQATKAAAERAILSSLKDPYSAVFGRILYARLSCTDGTFHTVCTIVNAKNSYGGYTGDDLWLYRVDNEGRGGLVMAITDTKDMNRSLDRLELIAAVTDACVTFGK